MADNTTLNAGSGGDVIATDDVGGVKYQVVKLAVGADGAASLVADANPIPISDASGSITVDGTVAVTNAGLTELAAAINASSQMDVNIAASSASVAVTNAGITTIAGAVSGTEMQVDVVAALPAGTNNIGDVDVLSVVPGTGATSLGKAVDSAAGGTDTGVALLAIRDDALTTLTPVDGDYVPLRVSSTGALHVTGSTGTTQYAEDAVAASGDSLCVVGAVRRDTAASSSAADGDYVTLNTNATGALRVTIDSITGSQTDDAAFTPGTSIVSVIGAEFDDTTPDSVDEGDGGALRMSANRNLYSTIRDAAGNERGANVNASNQLAIAGPVTNAGTFAVQADSVIPGTGATNLGKAEDGAHTSGDVGVQMLAVRTDTPANRSGTDGDYEPLQVSAGRLWTSSTVTSLPASTNTLEVVGDVADDAATGGNPVLVAGVAVETDGTDPTTVSAEGDAAYLRTDRARRLLVSEHHPRSFFTSADYASAQTNASVQAAPGAGLSLYITDIVISNGATAGNITLLDGSGGTVKFEIYPAINGGCTISLRQPIRLTANTALCITSTTVTTHSVNIGGYTAP